MYGQGPGSSLGHDSEKKTFKGVITFFKEVPEMGTLGFQRVLILSSRGVPDYSYALKLNSSQLEAFSVGPQLQGVLMGCPGTSWMISGGPAGTSDTPDLL